MAAPAPLPLVALALDGPNNALFEAWLEDGTLPNLHRLRASGVSGRLHHRKRFRNALCWDILLTGQEPQGAGAVFSPESYAFRNLAPQDLEAPPFYAGLKGRKVCVFDLIAPLLSDFEGMQVIGWGCELNAFTPQSQPAGLLDELIARHGADPKMETAYLAGPGAQGFRNPNIYLPEDLARFMGYLAVAIERRTAIMLDLLQRDRWDLFLGVYPEVHTANHLFWHLGQSYPVPSPFTDPTDPLREVYRKVDASIGVVADRLGEDNALLVYTIDETGPNAMDLPSMALLPELLWRWSGNQAALYDQSATDAVPPRHQDYRDHWKDEIWGLRTPNGDRYLQSPATLTEQHDPLNWHPAAWYRQHWPKMRAFALPSVADGHIRINLAGREANGTVPLAQFAAEIATLKAMLAALIDPRTGAAAVAEVIQTRERADASPDVPPDLIVVWRSDPPLDCLDHPTLGRFGPAPYFRSGGHRGHGTQIENSYFLSGGAISHGTLSATDGLLSELPATILALIGEAPQRTPLIAAKPKD